MGEVVGRKKKAVVAGALALTLGAGLGLGAVAWGSEGSVPEGGVQSGDVWGPLVGKKLEEKAGALARSHRAEVQRALAAYRASEAVEREAATEAGEQTPAEAAGAQDAHLSAEGPGASSGEASDEGSGAADSIAPGTLVVGGTAIPYRDVRGGATPSSGGGLWLGSDAVDDGSWGYFVGHNPGSFAPVRSLSSGDAVVVCDRSGAQRAYTVREVFQVEETATWKTIASRVTGYGESVVLQTCAGDGMNVIVVAA